MFISQAQRTDVWPNLSLFVQGRLILKEKSMIEYLNQNISLSSLMWLFMVIFMNIAENTRDFRSLV